MRKHRLVELIVAIGLCLSAGVIGSVFTAQAIPTWYATLEKPWFNPPNWIFGPVWTTLYILMGISLYKVWQEKKTAQRQKALHYFYTQLVLNTLWSIIFFGWKEPFVAFLEIVILLAIILLTIRAFMNINKHAAYLLLPYGAWVSFATILNFAIFVLN